MNGRWRRAVVALAVIATTLAIPGRAGAGEPPAPPTIGVATAGDFSATVRWTHGSLGGDILGYVITPYFGYWPLPAISFDSSQISQYEVTGLNAGTTYRFRVQARNADGTSGYSRTSNPVTPTAPSPPDPPTIIRNATAGDGTATVNWIAPGFEGASPIIGYLITPYVGYFPLRPIEFPGTATTQVVTGLTNGTTYRFKVQAKNAEGGYSGYSAVTNPVTPAPISLTGVSEIALGDFHSCALLEAGTARCWGSNSNGQLGTGTTVTNSQTPVAVSGLSGAGAITAGSSHTCALLGDSSVRCWGKNLTGQLGDGTTTDSFTPEEVSGLSGAVAIAAGTHHTCALLGDSTVRCWGYNYFGQLGDGTTTDSLTPVAVSGLSGVVAIATGASHSCGLLDDGTARCWGNNLDGRLGDGSTTSASTPVVVSGLTGVLTITAGAHSCAALDDGTARCWGGNVFGRLGDGTTVDAPAPVTVSGLTDVARIAADEHHTCALVGGGSARCWGHNLHGQLGDGSTADSSTAVTVSGLADAVAIAVGFSHSCAQLADSTVACWGDDGSGQLGNGTATASTIPVTVRG